MKTLILSPAVQNALLQTVEQAIDMLNDLAVDPMWMNPEMVRMLAAKSDDEIRTTMSENSKAVYANIDQLVSLELLRNELKED